jgi:putative membrane protein
LLLLPHTVLAAALLPLVPLTLWGAWKGQRADGDLKSPNLRGNFAFHRKMARWTFPIWLYVSATGVLIYLILYQIYP